MAQLLHERMESNHVELFDNARERETSLVKTFLIEAHHSDARSRKNTPASVIANCLQGLPYRVEAFKTEDSDLTVLRANKGKKSAELFVDHSNRRYWLAHSISLAEPVDKLIADLIHRSSGLDSAWLPTQFLESIAQLGAFRGLGIRYDRRFMKESEQDDQTGVAYLKMQLWGNKAPHVLNVLRADEAFPQQASLSRVRLKYSLDGENSADDNKFSLSNVWYSGKISARGTSFAAHLSLASAVTRQYADHIAAIEEYFSLRTSKIRKGAVQVSGEPVNFEFDTPIPDIRHFVQRVFSCARPFRLFGVAREVESTVIRIQAVDLHGGYILGFEIRPDFIRLFLPDGACANTVLRFYTNLQQHVDATVRAVSNSGVNILAI